MSVILPHWPKLFTVNDRETVVLSVIESVPERSNRAMAVIGIPKSLPCRQTYRRSRGTVPVNAQG